MDLTHTMDGVILLISGFVILLFAFGKLFPDLNEKVHGLDMPLRILGGSMILIGVFSLF
ncbi:hypothetical protein [Pseudoalteromonas luteoviolacea]|uniref:Uncharacterized protein n=1 Tax=Pseudoalteromonas luteoviolacea S4054 TaxID=1129367 RepID=A0A0F6A8K8_9GAMM|nr:hypothetical protein [Pseudoalteromonas luteoviolacea]KKE82505.1 hypothetical protein N479_18025 [Pseudoalteromonas luteoviolacea S4054]KZN72042.1 hypothetical protein N481_16660 [Pseudoalteromonas luteoviolacea S4047-1]